MEHAWVPPTARTRLARQLPSSVKTGAVPENVKTSTGAFGNGLKAESRTAMDSWTPSFTVTVTGSDPVDLTCTVTPAGRAMVCPKVRVMKAAICPLVTGSSGAKRPPPTPRVMPNSYTRRMAL